MCRYSLVNIHNLSSFLKLYIQSIQTIYPILYTVQHCIVLHRTDWPLAIALSWVINFMYLKAVKVTIWGSDGQNGDLVAMGLVHLT